MMNGLYLGGHDSMRLHVSIGIYNFGRS